MAHLFASWLQKLGIQSSSKRSLLNLRNAEGQPLSAQDLKGFVDLLAEDSELSTMAHQITDAELEALFSKQIGC